MKMRQVLAPAAGVVALVAAACVGEDSVIGDSTIDGGTDTSVVDTGAGDDAPPADAPPDAPECPVATEKSCNGTCIDVSKDKTNCGGCDTKCVYGDCLGGICAEKIIFVSSKFLSGDMQGVAKADAECTALAKAAKLHGASYKAWLSDGTMSASQRLEHTTLPYVRVDGKIVAANWGDLTDLSLQRPIELMEDGGVVDSSIGNCTDRKRVWTGTEGTAAPSDYTCLGWSSASSMEIGSVGNAKATDLDWSGGCSGSCDSVLPIYCVEQ